jgi:hypothetical protein
VDIERLRHWRLLCEFLYARQSHSAYRWSIPSNLQYLLWAETRKERNALAVVFYSQGWGWRLRKDWQEKLAKAEAEVSA